MSPWGLRSRWEASLGLPCPGVGLEHSPGRRRPQCHRLILHFSAWHYFSPIRSVSDRHRPLGQSHPSSALYLTRAGSRVPGASSLRLLCSGRRLATKAFLAQGAGFPKFSDKEPDFLATPWRILLEKTPAVNPLLPPNSARSSFRQSKGEGHRQMELLACLGPFGSWFLRSEGLSELDPYMNYGLMFRI